MTVSAGKSRVGRGAILGLVVALAAACGDDATGPEVQVIEEVEFAASLGIDLAQMQRVGSGIYILDLAPGEGEAAAVGDDVRLRYTGWLTNGSTFDSGTFSFVLGRGDVIQGFDEGVEGMLRGGVRKIVIPPELAYGNFPPAGIPPGAILVFEVEVLTINGS